MPTTRNFLLGRDLTAINLFVGTRAADGSATWSATANSLSTYVDYVRVSDERMVEMIASVDQLVAHYEKVLMDSSLVIGEILRKKNLTDVPILPGLAQGNDLLKVVFTRGGQTYTYYGQIQGFTDGVSAFGKNACELTLKPFYDGTNAPLAMA